MRVRSQIQLLQDFILLCGTAHDQQRSSYYKPATGLLAQLMSPLGHLHL